MLASTPGFRTGLREIDAGNEGLSFLLERVFDPGVECTRGSGHCDQTACGKIEALLRYLGRNFAGQERAMEAGGYGARHDHRREHQNVLDGLRALQKTGICGHDDAGPIRDFVAAWSLTHVQRCDRPLADWAMSEPKPH